MILIHVKQWLGPSRIAQYSDSSKRGEVTDESFISVLPPIEAVQRLRNYENAFNEHYKRTTAVNYTVLGLSTFEADARGVVYERNRLCEFEQLLRASAIETLSQKAEDFE